MNMGYYLNLWIAVWKLKKMDGIYHDKRNMSQGSP